MSERALLEFFREVHRAVDAGNRGDAPHPYRSGTFMVSAVAGDVELTVKDISEEDAVLIAAELRELGARALLQGSQLCPACGQRVPSQSYCVNCRGRLPDAG